MTTINFGVGIVTCDRQDFLKMCIDSLPDIVGNEIPLVIVNDGKSIIEESVYSGKKNMKAII